MNIILIFTCIGLAIFAMTDGFNALFMIAPIITLALFLFMLLNKSNEELKNLMKVIFSAHIAVMAAVTQGVFAFNVEIGNALVLVVIAAVLVVFMIFALKNMFRKMEEFNAMIKSDSNESDNQQ